MTTMYNQGYQPMPYSNPMMNAQQRLAQMEQQFPQFAQPQVGQMSQGYQQGQQQPMYIKCRAVTSFDEAKAAMIDLDGSLHVFTDIGNRKIYTKQINLDGTASLNTYVLDAPAPVAPVVSNPANENIVSRSLFDETINSLKEELSALQMKFEQRGEMNVQTEPVYARNGKRSTKSGDANAD